MLGTTHHHHKLKTTLHDRRELEQNSENKVISLNKDTTQQLLNTTPAPKIAHKGQKKLEIGKKFKLGKIANLEKCGNLEKFGNLEKNGSLEKFG